MEDTIGVIIATYNGEKYIKEQLNSIIDQSIKPELIVVSDGNSKDRTVEICQKILCKSSIPYVILKSTFSLSVVENFQKGLERCNCKYIFFSDQDDVWLTDKIETYLFEMRRYHAYMAFSDARIVDEDLKTEKNTQSLWKKIEYNQTEQVRFFPKGDKELLNILLKHNVVTGMTICIRNELKSYILPFSKYGLHDSWISFIALYYGNIIAINKITVLYRQHNNNVVGTSKNLKKTIINSKTYYSRTQNRELFINDFLEQISGINNDFIKNIKEYYNYLSRRVSYFKGKENLFFPIYNNADYKKYEHDYLQIIIKDLIIKLKLSLIDETRKK